MVLKNLIGRTDIAWLKERLKILLQEIVACDYTLNVVKCIHDNNMPQAH